VFGGLLIPAYYNKVQELIPSRHPAAVRLALPCAGERERSEREGGGGREIWECDIEKDRERKVRKTDRPTEPESEIDERKRDTREGRE
jgi:hypothetical protein